MTKTAVVLTSHGKMAVETLKSAEMIVGKTDRTYCFSMHPSYSIEKTTGEFSSLLVNLGRYDQVIIFADLYGGTPCNVAIRKILEDEKYHLITGFNLGMIVETLTALQLNQELSLNAIIDNAKAGITNVSEKFR